MTDRQRKRAHMVLWSILALPVDPPLSWRFLFAWAELGGKSGEVQPIRG